MNLIAFLILSFCPSVQPRCIAALSQKKHAPYPYHPNIYLFAYPLRA